MNEVEKLLTDALAVLRKDGWCKYWLINDVGEYCSIGAIEVGAVNGMSMPPTWWIDAHTVALRALHDVIVEQYPDDNYQYRSAAQVIAYWNNAPERKFADIEGVFEKAIVNL